MAGFLAFVTPVLIPALQRIRPDAVVVMDARKSLRDFADLVAHKAAVMRRALDQAGITCHYLPASSPDLRQMVLGHFRENLVEQAWSKLKTCLRARAARSREAPGRAIPQALATVTPATLGGAAMQATR